MVSFSHDEQGRKLSIKVAKRVQELYEVKCKKANFRELEILDEESKEAYLIAIEEENRNLQESLWHTVLEEERMNNAD